MSVTAALVRKEARALGGLWLIIAAGIVAGELPGHDLRELEVIVYVLGALGLGAASMGNGDRYGTMSQLLTLPVPRSGAPLAAKLGVLTPALLGIAAIAVAFAAPGRLRWTQPADRPLLLSLFVLPVAYGFTVAPWLALKTRSALAGALFSGAMAALLLIAGDRMGAVVAGEAGLDWFKLRVLWGGSALLIAWSAVGLWRSFLRLEVSDAAASDVVLSLPTSRTATFAPRHPLLLLAAKELRLQQLTIVASLIYTGLCLALAARHFSPATLGNILEIATAIHLMVVAALAGAFSCAEERVLGTLDWQLLLPPSARTQFTVKALMAVGLVLLLTIGLPAVVSTLLGVPVGHLPRPRSQRAAGRAAPVEQHLHIERVGERRRGVLRVRAGLHGAAVVREPSRAGPRRPSLPRNACRPAHRGVHPRRCARPGDARGGAAAARVGLRQLPEG